MWFYETCSLPLLKRASVLFFFCNISVVWLKISGHKLHHPLFQQSTILFCFRIDLKCKLWVFLSSYGTPHVCLDCNTLWDYVLLECSQRKLIGVVTFHMYPECDLVMFYLKVFVFKTVFSCMCMWSLFSYSCSFLLHEDHDFLVMCESCTPQCRSIGICISSVLMFLYLFSSTYKTLP